MVRFYQLVFFLVLILFLFQRTNVYAQQDSILIKGTVVDENGERILGVNIYDKIEQKGTITDYDGNFSLYVNKDAIIVFSWIGYEKVEMPAAEIENSTIHLKERALMHSHVNYYSNASIGYFADIERLHYGAKTKFPIVSFCNLLLKIFDENIYDAFALGIIYGHYKTDFNNSFDLKIGTFGNKLFAREKFKIYLEAYYQKRDIYIADIKEYTTDLALIPSFEYRKIGALGAGFIYRNNNSLQEFGGHFKYSCRFKLFKLKFNSSYTLINNKHEYSFGGTHELNYFIKGLSVGYSYNKYNNY